MREKHLEEMLEEANKQETASGKSVKFWILNKEPKHGVVEKLRKEEEEVCPIKKQQMRSVALTNTLKVPSSSKAEREDTQKMDRPQGPCPTGGRPVDDHQGALFATQRGSRGSSLKS